MTSKYIFRAALSILSIVFLSSCLGSSTAGEFEPSRDAQIYAFSLETHSNNDTARILPTTAFTIDQVGGRIFNRQFLPYQFNVDSVVLNIEGTSAAWAGLKEIQLHLVDPDSSFTLSRGDSVYVRRLARIETTAVDGETKKTYHFQLNVYQSDPFVISWNQQSNNYISSSIQAQRTILLNNQFITYYRSGGALVASLSADGVTWTNASLSGMPATAQLPLITVANNAAYVIDDNNSVYKTTDGSNWSTVPTDLPVTTIYGVMPTASGGNIIAVVNDNGTLKFASTKDFTQLTVMNALNDMPNNADITNRIPMTGFSSTQIDNPVVYGARFVVISGGTTSGGLGSDGVWILEEREEMIGGARRTVINALPVNPPSNRSFQGSSLFYYDNRLYAFFMRPDGSNNLMFSTRYGLEWLEVAYNEETGELDTFPDNFTNRTHASIITDANNFIWLFGGRTSLSGEITDTWRGRLNRLEEKNN